MKRKAIYVIVGLVIFFAVIGSIAGNGEEKADSDPETEETKEVEKEVVDEAKEEKEPDEEAVCLDTIEDTLESSLQEEGGFYLHKIEYEDEQVNITVDYQEDPVLPADELKEYNETWTWRVAEAIPEVGDQDFNVRVMAVTTEEGTDELIHWGTTRYTYDDENYTWRDGPGMQILD